MKPSIELIRLLAVLLITFTHTRNNLTEGISYFIVEELPKLGTAILSIISGYLYFEVSRKKENLFQKKIKTLLIPYLIANVVVLCLVVISNYIVGYNPLNRLTFDSSLILEGVFALNSPPINPPTYFIRDIFVVFCVLALLTQKEFKTLIILIPILLFGTLFLRIDVVMLFILGILYAKYNKHIKKSLILLISVTLSIIFFFYWPYYLKLPFSLLLFALVIDLDFNFYNTGRYSYLLHLYHSPIMVISYPIYSLYVKDEILTIILQIITAIVVVYCLFLLTKKYAFLKIMSGGR